MVESRLKRWLYGIRRFFQQTLLGRALALVSLPLLLLGIAFYEPNYHPPIFDAQVHYNEESWQRVRVEAETVNLSILRCPKASLCRIIVNARFTP